MVGKYKILMGTELQNLTFKNNELYYKDLKINGSLLLTFVPPKDLYRPFLLYRTKDGRTLNPLCRTCCEFKITICNHETH
jgi:hypothetical protein